MTHSERNFGRSIRLRVFLWCGLFLTSKSVLLGGLSFDSSFTSSLDLGTLGIHLFLESPLTLLLGLGLVDLLCQLV